MAESGIFPEVKPRGLTIVHSGSLMQEIGRGFIKIYPGLVQPN